MAAALIDRRALFVVLTALAAVLLTPTTAAAHAGFVSSQPEPGARLGTAPGVVVLRFSEPLNAKLSRAAVADPDGRIFHGSVAAGDGMRISVSSNAQGVYRVDWTTVSLVDGHTLSGSFAFGVGVSPGPGAVGGTGDEPRPSDLALAVGRTAEDFALLLSLGMLLVRRLGRRAPRLDWVSPRVRPALVVAFVAGIAVVVGEALAAAPTPAVGAVVTYLTTGLPGGARLLRVALEGAALGASLIDVELAAPLLAGALLALAAAGHADAIDPRWWGIVTEWAHLLSAALWAGGIVALATLRPTGGWRGDQGRALLDRFSPIALGAFSVTVATGIAGGIQEVGSLRALFTSAYGLVLLVKGFAVLLMAQLSILAWRRMVRSMRVEAAAAVVVIAAAALLAAFPLPPARVAEAESAVEAAAAASALLRPGDLTLGGHAGQVLVGLTIRPGEPGPDEVLLYLLPLEGEGAAAGLVSRLAVDGRDVPLQECGPTCRSAHSMLRLGDRIQVHVEGSQGGTASFLLPSLASPDGTGILGNMTLRMHELTSYREDETLSSGLAVVNAKYAFVAPDEMSQEVTESGSRSQVVWIGGTRYLKQSPQAPGQVEKGGPRLPVPAFIWDSFRPFLDARVVGSARVNHVPTTIVAFFGDSAGLPIWFRLWIDGHGLVHRTEMRAQGHFMDHRYYDFDDSIRIVPPTGKGSG